MKKFIGMAAAVVLAGATATAGVTGEFRTSYRSSTEDDGTTETKTAGFGVDWAQVAWTGMAGEGVSYNARFDLIDEDAATVEYAYVARKFSDSISLRVGLLYLTQGGYETKRYDSQLYSRSTFGNWSVANQGGAGLDYSMGDHALTLEVFNAVRETGAGAETNDDSKTMKTIAYTGKFGQVEAKATMTAGSAQNFDAGGEYAVTDFAADAAYSMTTVGASLGMVPGWLFEIDYGMGKIEKGEAALSATNEELEQTGFVLNAAMTEGMYRGVAKYWMAEITNNDGTESTFDSTGMSLALEVVPGGEDFRYFVAYKSSELKPETGSSTKETALIAGLTLNTDFLK